MIFVAGLIIGCILGVFIEALITGGRKDNSRIYEEGFQAGCLFMKHTKMPNETTPDQLEKN